MAEQGFQERTEKATDHRRKKAREEGQVAKSQELNAAAILCLGFVTLYMAGPFLAHQAMQLMRYTMVNAPFIAAQDPTFATVFNENLVKFLILLTPIFAVLTIVAVGVNVAQVGFQISSKSMELKFDRLN
ncbi:MAG TPA: EscU/YscU/HrcU family type III secretion system export apparatus switch protein, partial [candidate division Zixibacteria bacterium]|nr:EscU/YscU/HrcU family type III secretion system export apparatus switch protein [candidate division Zixibacteria bacterium]